MRRSICVTKPSSAYAGQIATWRFAYTTATPLPKGTRLKFDPQFKKRPIDWEVPQAASKSKKNTIWLSLPGGKQLPPRESSLADPNATFEFTLPSELKVGETLEIFMGSTDGKEQRQDGNRAQTLSQRRRAFHLFIDPKGKGEYKDPEVFTIDVRGSKLHTIRVNVPSVLAKNKRFDVLIRFEDEFGNLTNQAPEGTLIELSYENLRESLNWKLFVPETGFIVLPNLYFNEPGVYRIQLLNRATGEKFFSSPIKCFAETDKSLFWGLLHGESQRVDSAENIESCLRHMRDEKSLQFFATSPFEAAEETSNDIWKLLTQQVAEYNEENRFASFLGCQWHSEEGVRELIYSKDNKPLPRKKDIKFGNLKKIYKSHSPKELLSMPSFTMAKGFETYFEHFTPEFERVVEIYNAWGSSECSKKEGNLRPITGTGKDAIMESEIGSIRKALNQNCSFGFTAGGLDDRGIYEGLYESSQQQYSPGLTAVLATEFTRDAIFLAIHNRWCYATTGERMVIGFYIAGSMMGNELSSKTKPGLVFNRHITGFVCATTPIREISIIRNGTVFHQFHPKTMNFDFTFDDEQLLSQFILSSPDDRPPFAYYYMRVVQEDGHIAWSSPIWIDYYESKATMLPKKTKNGKSG